MVNIDYTQAQNKALKKQNLDLQKDYAKLQKEYDILDGIIDVNNAKIGQLEKENKQLKELFEIESLTDIKTGETMYRSRQIIHFVDILQEIEKIAGHFECDCPSGHICVCSSCNKLDEILDIINKAEE